MQWELFNQVLVKLGSVSELDPERDATPYADQLLELHTHLFADLEGKTEGVAARIAARTIARDHLREVCRLRVRVEQIQASMANSSTSASERLVRTAALAYLACNDDLLSDDLPHGLGYIDDCILLRGARLATPAAPGTDYFIEDILEIQYLSLAVPEALLPALERALAYFAALWQRTRDLPDAVVERALTELIQSPPSEFPSKLDLPPPPPDWRAVDIPFALHPARLISVEGSGLELAFGDQRFTRARDGTLAYV